MGIVRTRDPLPRVDKGVYSAESAYEFKWIRDQIAGNEDDDDEADEGNGEHQWTSRILMHR